jgi:hypothetical protein
MDKFDILANEKRIVVPEGSIENKYKGTGGKGDDEEALLNTGSVNS